MFFLFMFIISLLIPFSMILLGYRYKTHPSTKISHISGYRTTRSMKSIENWTYAQKVFGKIWFKLGLLNLITIVPMFFVVHKSKNVISMVNLVIILIQMIIMCLVYFPVEKRLKKFEEKNGNI